MSDFPYPEGVSQTAELDHVNFDVPTLTIFAQTSRPTSGLRSSLGTTAPILGTSTCINISHSIPESPRPEEAMMTVLGLSCLKGMIRSIPLTNSSGQPALRLPRPFPKFKVSTFSRGSSSTDNVTNGGCISDPLVFLGHRLGAYT